ncbi:MAG: phospho-sugar mutase [Bacteriovoracaceae bacterium]|nr:phospho-sugar mutase [Bacteriovoracaceae bacterium]
MEQKILDLAKKWIENPLLQEEERQEILKLMQKENKEELTEAFYKDLEFGTGGMRSLIGIGPNRMNRYTIRRATHALALVIKKNHTQELLKAVISYDSRRMSQAFAQEAACVLAGHGFKVFIFNQLNPTPLLSFSIRKLKAHTGIMITASHNPPNYNGYKAYDQHGCQVVPPLDDEIINTYKTCDDISTIPYQDFSSCLEEKKIEWVGEELENSYLEMLKGFVINPTLCKEQGSHLKIIYTPLHGAGYKLCPSFLKQIGFCYVTTVPSQDKPDENFTTVEFPNPEDPKAFQQALILFENEKADVAMANDPDADRLGAFCRHKDQAVFLNGNQMGVLLLHYILSQLQEKKHLPTHPLVLKSIVTSELQSVICQSFKVKVINTLTGFKWMGGKLSELEKLNSPLHFIFASEESFGYLSHPHARDKDGINAAALFCEVALYYKLKNMSLIEALDSIYETYGFFDEKVIAKTYAGIKGSETINAIMNSFRQYKKEDSFANFTISSTEDYLLQTGTDKTIPQSDVLGITLNEGSKFFLRPSGTEPKIKFYLMMSEQHGTLEQKKKSAQEKIQKIEEQIETILLSVTAH